MRCRVVLLLALAVCAVAQQAPACDDARASCDADCAAQNLVATSFLCRDTPFGSIQSCSCGQPEAPEQMVPELPDPTTFAQPSSEQTFLPLPAAFSRWFSSSSESSSSSADQESTVVALPFDGPRRFGPQQGIPMEQDPYAAARVAILGNLLAQQRIAPVFALQLDMQRVHGEEMHSHHHHHLGAHEDDDDDDNDDDDDDDDEPEGACLMGLGLLVALVFTFSFLCTRAVRMMVTRPTRARMVPAQAAVLVETSSEDLASPLLVVHDYPIKA